jgi:hypothetical protein
MAGGESSPRPYFSLGLTSIGPFDILLVVKFSPLLSGAVLAIAICFVVPALDASADTVPSQTLRNVAGIVAHSGARTEQVGTAFFVAVPSQASPGQSFVYLVTAHHNLLDAHGSPRAGLMLALEDKTTGTMREDALPVESKWVLNPADPKIDIAAVPFSPEHASIAPIALSSLLGADDPFARPEVGAQVYYLTAATVGVTQKRFEALARFGHVSMAIPAQTEVIGAGIQQLAMLDGGGTPGYSSGAPVFVSAGLRFALWGFLEANSAAASEPLFSGLAGVLPSKFIVDTVRAMASVQDKGIVGKSAGN